MESAIRPPLRSSTAQDPAPPEHRTCVTEAGNFCVARCTCGWYAPARRSRDRARRDAADHPG